MHQFECIHPYNTCKQFDSGLLQKVGVLIVLRKKLKMNLKSRIFIFVARCIGGDCHFDIFTPILAGFVGILIDVYIYFRYGHTFNVLDEYLFFASKGVALGVIIGISGCIILLFRVSRA